jgi:hypothetical protein
LFISEAFFDVVGVRPVNENFHFSLC